MNNKKEKLILDCLETDMKENNFGCCKAIWNDENDFIEDSKRSLEFSDRIEIIRAWLFDSSSISFETNEYYKQENKMHNNPEILTN
jgi:hypothetical protein